MSKKFLLLASVLFLSFSFFPCRRAPQEIMNLNGFQIVLPAPRIEFPSAITFPIEAQSSSPITQIKLLYQVSKLSPLPVTSVAFPDLNPGPRVKTSWTWDMRRTGSLPPGAEIKYWWLLENAEGDSAQTSPSILHFDDSRYRWKSSQYSKVNLFWYEGTSSFAQELLSSAQGALQRLATDTGVQMERVAQVYIYASFQDLREAMVFPQEWTGGVAFSEYSIIALGISTSNLGWGKRAIAHEMAHLVVYQKTSGCSGTMLPTWLDEGIAMYAEGELSPDFQHVLDQAIQENILLSVRSLSSPFAAQTEQAYLSYAQSHSIISFLVHTYGRDKIVDLLEVFQQGSGYDQALLQVYGFDLEGLDAQWRSSVGAPPR